MEIWVRARRDPIVRRSYFRLDRRQRTLIAAIVRDGQETGSSTLSRSRRVRAGLSGLMDGLGVQMTLGQPDVSRRGWSSAA